MSSTCFNIPLFSISAQLTVKLSSHFTYWHHHHDNHHSLITCMWTKNSNNDNYYKYFSVYFSPPLKRYFPCTNKEALLLQSFKNTAIFVNILENNPSNTPTHVLFYPLRVILETCKRFAFALGYIGDSSEPKFTSYGVVFRR